MPGVRTSVLIAGAALLGGLATFVSPTRSVLAAAALQDPAQSRTEPGSQSFDSPDFNEGRESGGQNWTTRIQDTARDRVEQIAVAKDHSLWIATKNGLVHWTGYGDPTRLGRDQGLRQQQLKSVLVLRDGRVAVGGAFGVEIYNPATKQWSLPMPFEPIYRWECTRLSEGPDGSVWAACSEGLLRLRDGHKPALYGAPNRVRQLRAHMDIVPFGLPANLLKTSSIGHGTGVVTMAIGDQNIVCQIDKGSPADSVDLKLGDHLDIAPAPDTPAGLIRYRFTATRKLGRKGSLAQQNEKRVGDATARGYPAAERARLIARDVLIDRHRTLWASTGTRLIRVPLNVNGDPTVDGATLPELVGKARDIKLGRSNVLGAVWAYSRSPKRFPPQLFSRDAHASAVSELEFAEGSTKLHDLVEATDGSLFAATSPFGVQYSWRESSWKIMRDRTGAVQAKRLALSPDDHLYSALPDRGIGKLVPPAIARHIALRRSIADIAADGSRWYIDADGATTAISPRGTEQNYRAFSDMQERSKWVVRAMSGRVAWALGNCDDLKLRRYANGRVDEFQIPTDLGALGDIEGKLQVTSDGDAYIGPFGIDPQWIVRFSSKHEKQIYQAMDSGSSERWPIFEAGGRTFIVQDETVHPLPLGRDKPVLAITETDDSFHLASCHGAILSAVAKGDVLWFSTTLSELVRSEGGRSERIAWPVKAPIELSLAPDDSLWATTPTHALRLDAGTWNSVIAFGDLLGAKRGKVRVQPISSRDAFLEVSSDNGTETYTETDTETYRWQRQESPPRTRLRSENESTFAATSECRFVVETDVFWPVAGEDDVTIQYRIDSDVWSDWSSNKEIQLPDLAAGKHTIEVRSRRGMSVVEETPIRHEFSIHRGGSGTGIALAVFACLSLLSLLSFRSVRKHVRIARSDANAPREEAHAVLMAQTPLAEAEATYVLPSVPPAQKQPRAKGSMHGALLASRAAAASALHAQPRGTSPELTHDLRNLEMLWRAKLVSLESAQESREAEDAVTYLTGHLNDFHGPRNFDVAVMMRCIFKALSLLMPANIEIELDIDEESGEIFADSARFTQVVLNLAFNAHDASKQCGGKIIARCRPLDADDFAKLPLREGTNERMIAGVRIEVADFGVGMDQATIDRCFVDNFTTKVDIGHRGHGLATVKELVAGMGGTIGVQSKQACGSVFTIRLPEKRGKLPKDSPGEGFTHRILVCDDNILIREIVTRVLTAGKIDVIGAASGEELENALATWHDIDLLILDLHLGEVSGLALAEKIRASGNMLPILFISGDSENACSPQTAAIPQSSFLAKPFTSSKLWEQLSLLVPEKRH